MVKVRSDGRGMVRDVTIDPAVFEGRDAELLSDLILAAVAEVQRRAAELAKSEMKSLPGFPPLPGV